MDSGGILGMNNIDVAIVKLPRLGYLYRRSMVSGNTMFGWLDNNDDSMIADRIESSFTHQNPFSMIRTHPFLVEGR